MIIGVTSLKGGVGKSTITQNLAVCFAHQGYSVCIADVDTNKSCLRWSEYRAEDLPNIMVTGYDDSTMLTKNVAILEGKFDIVLVDGTPSLNETASRVIYVADILVVPILSGAMDMWATEKFISRYLDTVDRKGKDIPAYFLLNQFDKRVTLSNEMKELVEQSEHLKTLSSTIGHRVAYREANIQGKGVYEYNNKKAKDEMILVTNEILEQFT